MTDSKMDPQHGNDITRRTALQKIATGVGVVAGISLLPERWTSPIIGRVVLPAHAATSGSTLHDPCQIWRRQGDSTSTEVIIRVTGFVTPPTGNLPVKVVATAVGGANQQVTANTTTSAAGTFEAFMTIGGGPGITSVNVQTTVTGADGTASCSVNLSAAENPCLVPAGPLTINAGEGVTVNWPGGDGPHTLDADFVVNGTPPTCWTLRECVFAPSQPAGAGWAMYTTSIGQREGCNSFYGRAESGPCPET
jgi:hypothetical protein